MASLVLALVCSLLLVKAAAITIPNFKEDMVGKEGNRKFVKSPVNECD